MEIERALILSTAHITRETADLLDDMQDSARLIVYAKGGCGWWIYTGRAATIDRKLPPELLRCIDTAQKQRCAWLMLDRDALPDASIPTYDW